MTAPRLVTTARCPPMSEADFQAAVLDLCALRKLHWYHTHDSRRSNPGWPDLVIVGSSVLFRELKARDGRLTFHQELWGHRLEVAGQDWDVWRPADLRSGRIQMELETIR